MPDLHLLRNFRAIKHDGSDPFFPHAQLWMPGLAVHQSGEHGKRHALFDFRGRKFWIAVELFFHFRDPRIQQGQIVPFINKRIYYPAPGEKNSRCIAPVFKKRECLYKAIPCNAGIGRQAADSQPIAQPRIIRQYLCRKTMQPGCQRLVTALGNQRLRMLAD